jgi:hypothetical protein
VSVVYIQFGSISEQRTGSYEHSNESSGTAKGVEFLDLLSDYWFLKVDAIPGIFEDS